MATDDFFRAWLDAMIDLKHPLAVLCTRLPWAATAILAVSFLLLGFCAWQDLG